MSTIRTIEFPASGLPGTVHYLVVPELGDVLQGEVEPRGTVDLPGDAELILIADGDSGELADLASMPPDTFMQLELTGVTDRALEAVGRMTGVALLSLAGDFTDGGISALADLAALQTLVLESPNITGRAPLPRAPITELCLAGNRITDDVFATACELPLLSLSVAGDGITGQGLGALERSLGLQALSLMSVSLRPHTLRKLACLPVLETVSIIPGVVDQALAEALLSLVPPLTEVDLAPQYGELDAETVSRLLAAGLMVNGVAASPQAAPAFARALTEHAHDPREPDREPARREALLAITREDDLDLLLEQPTPVLVQCGATWCDPCTLLTAALEQIVAEADDAVVGVTLDVDRVPWAVDRFDLHSLPTCVLLRDGVELLRFVGAQPKGQIEQMISMVMR